MSSRSITLTLITAVTVLCCFVFAQTKQPLVASKGNEYQLVPTQVTINAQGQTWESHRVFLVDTTSGRVWEYSPESMSKQGVFSGAFFSGVTVGAPTP